VPSGSSGEGGGAVGRKKRELDLATARQEGRCRRKLIKRGEVVVTAKIFIDLNKDPQNDVDYAWEEKPGPQYRRELPRREKKKEGKLSLLKTFSYPANAVRGVRGGGGRVGVRKHAVEKAREWGTQRGGRISHEKK